MKRSKTKTVLRGNWRALSRQPKKPFTISLFVTGATPRSSRAIVNARKFCNKYLDGRYTLKVIDIYQQPEAAESQGIVAAPTLIKYLPLPLRRFVGDLSDSRRLLVGLNLPPQK